MSILVQEAGFEPANRYGLGPHPSAFDQAGQLLRYASLIKRIYQHILRGRPTQYNGLLLNQGQRHSLAEVEQLPCCNKPLEFRLKSSQYQRQLLQEPHLGHLVRWQ